MKKKYLILIPTLLFSFFSNAEYVGNPKNGKKLFKKKSCYTCHRKDGMGKAKIKKGKLKLTAMAGPRIAGLNESYIVTQLSAIQGKDKSSVRKSKYTASMKSKIKKLTQEDFNDLATYIANEINPKAGVHVGLLEE